MLNKKLKYHLLLAAVGVFGTSAALAQFSQLITGFEQNSLGDTYLSQVASYGDLQVVVFQDPAEADVTTTAVVDDGAAAENDREILVSSEESFVVDLTGESFLGANGSSQFLSVRFEWASTDPNRWVLIETLQSPNLGDPSIHLDGTVSFYVNIPDCTAVEFPDLQRPGEIGVALLVSETGSSLPLGFQDNAVLEGSFEFVGVSEVLDANSANPIPVPTTFIPITDADCSGTDTGPTGDWRLVTFDLDTAGVAGWVSRGGDGVLDATDPNDLSKVNRGVLAGIVLTVPSTDTTTEYVEFNIDELTFDAPITDPAVAPSIVTPVIFGDTSVIIDGLTPRATSVILEVDRFDPNTETLPLDPNVFAIDDSFSTSPGLSTTGELRSTSINVLPALNEFDRIRARQAVGGDIGPDSVVITVNPPAAFSATLSLDEDGASTTIADFEFVGAISTTPVGKPIFPANGQWQKLEYSLIPGVEPVISFAGGNNALEPDGGNYSIDALFFAIDATVPNTGPYEIFIDGIFYVDENDNTVVFADAETENPVDGFRGQSTSIPASQLNELSGITSFDGTQSIRLQWEFPDTSPSNIAAPLFRPAIPFPDSAKSIGMWLLVEDPRQPNNPAALPSIGGPIYGNAPTVTINDIDANATLVDVYVNGNLTNSTDPAGATSVSIAPGVALAINDSVSARVTANGSVSDFAYPQVSQLPPAPVVSFGLLDGDTSVTVNVLAGASDVSVFANDVLIGSTDPAGLTSVNVPTSALIAGDLITATQTVNGALSPVSDPKFVGDPAVAVPVIASPICAGNHIIEVSNIDPNATDVTIFDDSLNVVVSRVPTGTSTLRLFVNPAISLGTSFVATQTVVNPSSISDSVTATACDVEDFCLEIFSDDMDTDTSASYNVIASPDTLVTFAYDYSADDIPPSPNGSGTTIGIKAEANLDSSDAEDIVIISPIGIDPNVDFTMQFDFWINFAVQGSGTTEFIGAGVGHDGVTVGMNGASFIGTGEGGSSRDYRMFKDAGEQFIGSGQYAISTQNASDPGVIALFPAQFSPDGQGQSQTDPNVTDSFAGEMAFAWHRMEVIVDVDDQTVKFKIDDFEFGTLACGGENGATCNVQGALQMIYRDLFTSVASQPEFMFGIFDNIVVLEDAVCTTFLLGDVNCDGLVDVGDISPFINALLDAERYAQRFPDCNRLSADINEDGDVDAGDISPFVRCILDSGCP